MFVCEGKRDIQIYQTDLVLFFHEGPLWLYEQDFLHTSLVLYFLKQLSHYQNQFQFSLCINKAKYTHTRAQTARCFLARLSGVSTRIFHCSKPSSSAPTPFSSHAHSCFTPSLRASSVSRLEFVLYQTTWTKDLRNTVKTPQKRICLRDKEISKLSVLD